MIRVLLFLLLAGCTTSEIVVRHDNYGPAECSNASQCPVGDDCRNGYCQPLRAGQCISNDDCPRNQVCQDRACVRPLKSAAR